MQISHTFYKQDYLNYDIGTCKWALAENQESRHFMFKKCDQVQVG